MTTEARIYIGTPSALQAEVGLHPCYTGKYIVAAFNAAGEEITPESASSIKEANAVAAEIGAWLESLGETVVKAWI
jgi:hypothetical protein